MQILFDAGDAEASGMRDLAERRLRSAMRRLSWLVPRAEIQLRDINGPRGGVDKRCQVALRTDRGATVVVTALARDWRSAVDNAVSRAARALLRSWQRRRGPAGVDRRAVGPA